MVGTPYYVSGTSQRTKSHQCAFKHLSEANVCTPRPTSSRVTTADGRSPGSRVVTLRRLPRTEIPSGIGRKIHRLQLRGQPRHWGGFPAPHSLLIPKRGEPSKIMVGVCRDQSQSRHWARVILTGRVRLFCRMTSWPDRNELRRGRSRAMDEHSKRHGDG